jgi:alanine racemase
VEERAERATRAIVDLSAIAANVGGVRRRVGPSPHVMAVVKADGYGHGAVQVARAALASSADWLGVALPEEGEELRRAGLTAPILVLGLIRPEEAPKVVGAGLDQVVASEDLVAALARAAARARKVVHVHLKVETGMGRIGVAPEEAVPLARRVAREKGLALRGVFSHLAAADTADKGFAREQLARFEVALSALRAAGIEVPLRHIANSAAILDLPEATYDMVRPGIMMYGLPPSDEVSSSVPLRPAMTFVTRVAAVKTVPAGTSISYGRTFTTKRRSVIATLPLGYADGLSRRLSDRWEVSIRGARVPLVGTICMDMCMADVTDLGGVERGEEAVLFGETPSATEMAERLGTINYEVVCAVGKRVPRVYLGT